MTIAEAIAGLRRDVASLELTEAVGVVIDADWPKRMEMLLASHDRLVAALQEIEEMCYPNEGRADIRKVAFKALARLNDQRFGSPRKTT